MKLIIERSDLAGALARVAGIVAKRGTIPILNNVLIEADKGALTIRATDLDMEATVTVAAAIETGGRVTVPAVTLLDIAKSLPDGAQVAMTYDADAERLAVTSGRSRWKLPTLPADTFPALKPEVWGVTVHLGGAFLADVLTRTVWAAATELNRQNMMGVNVGICGGDLTAVAGRGPQMAVAKMDVADVECAAVTIPTAMVHEMVRAAGEGPVTLAVSERKVGLLGDGWSITSKIIAMPYVDYAPLMALERQHAFTVDKADLITAVRRATITSERGGEKAVALGIDGETLSVSTRATFGEGDDEIACSYDGPATRLGLEAAALLEMLAAVKGERVTVRFTAEATTPVLLVGTDESVAAVSGLMRV